MALKPRRVVILGSSGTIGRVLSEQFSRRNDIEVLGYTSSSCNLLEPEESQKVFSGLTKDDAVIMLSTINRLNENSLSSMKKNIEMAENVSRFLQRYPVGHFIFFSTIDVYGVNLNDDEIITEKTLPDPDDYYALSKLSSEYLLKKSCLKNNIPLLILRLAGVYGPDDHGRSTVSILLNGAKQTKKVQVAGQGDSMRDFVFIGDMYKIVCSAMRATSAGLLNVATGRSYSILQALPFSFDVSFVPDSSKNTEKRVKNLIFDTSAMKRCFPDLTLTDLREGLSLYLSGQSHG
jgi:UDP-glucose 4-epimerase